MKLKAPKPWQMVVILVVVFVLAIGGSFLAVYLTGGFEPNEKPPEEIEIEDVDNRFNQATGQYEVVDPFSIRVTTQTEDARKNQITFSFPADRQTTKVGEGKISDGVIIINETAQIGDKVEIELVQQSYTNSQGIAYEKLGNKGGISQLVVTTENNVLPSTTLQIAVDVPVFEIELELQDTTPQFDGTQRKYSAKENENVKIAENTNFEATAVFYPAASRYRYSDDQNSQIGTAREKRVFYTVGIASQGIRDQYNNGDVYFVAADETSPNNIINAYAFPNSMLQEQNVPDDPDETEAVYRDVVSLLDGREDSIRANVLVDIVEATIGNFSLKNTSSNPFKVTTNKLFELMAGSDEENGLEIFVGDGMGGELTSMIKNVGIKVVSVVRKGDEQKTNLVDRNLVKIVGGSVDGKMQEQDGYVIIDSDVKNLRYSKWEISSNGEYDVELEAVVFWKNEQGEYEFFKVDEEIQTRSIFLEIREHDDEPVAWKNLPSQGLEVVLTYNGTQTVLNQLDLSDKYMIPVNNTYQKVVFFVFEPERTDSDWAQNVVDDITSFGAGIYTDQIPGITEFLQPLRAEELKLNDETSLKILFAVVRTDAYGTPIDADGNKLEQGDLYVIEAYSEVQTVKIRKTLRTPSSISYEFGGSTWLYDAGNTGRGYYLVPRGTHTGTTVNGTNYAFKIVLQLQQGDASLFENEWKHIQLVEINNATNTQESGYFEYSTSPYVNLENNTVEIGVNISNKAVSENQDVTAIMQLKIQMIYNNSSSLSQTTTWDVSEPKNSQVPNYIAVYDQIPTSIQNTDLEGKYFNVKQYLDSEGESKVIITEADESGNPKGSTTFENWADFNSKIANNVIRDNYNRAGNFDFEVSSSNPSVIGVFGDKKELGAGSSNISGGGNIVISVSAIGGSSSATYTFTIVKVETQGVVDIEVNGTSAPNTLNPTHTIVGEPQKGGSSNTVDLKNLIKIYVSNADGVKTAYNGDCTYNFSQSFIAGLGDNAQSFWDMIEIKDSEGKVVSQGQESTASISSITIKQNFGVRVPVTFNASGANGAMRFTFVLTIEPCIDFGENKLGQVQYSNGDGIGGVVNPDGGVIVDDNDSILPGDIRVYAQYNIDLDEYLPVNYTAVSSSYTSSDPHDKDFWQTLGDWKKPSSDETLGYSFADGKLCFYEVSSFQALKFTLYSLVTTTTEGNTIGNIFGLSKELSFVVYPNFAVRNVITEGTENVFAMSTLAEGGNETGVNLNKYVQIARIADDKNHTSFNESYFSKIDIVDDNGIDQLGVTFSGNEINNCMVSLINPLVLDYGQQRARRTVRLYVGEDENAQVVATGHLDFEIGVDIYGGALANGAAKGWMGEQNFRVYRGTNVLVVPNGLQTFTISSASNLSPRIRLNNNAYTRQDITGQEGNLVTGYTLNFMAGSEIRFGENIYLYIEFSSQSSQAASFAQIKVPLLITTLLQNNGERKKFPYYESEKEDLSLFLDATQQTHQAQKQVSGGKEYSANEIFGDSSSITSVLVPNLYTNLLSVVNDDGSYKIKVKNISNDQDAYLIVKLNNVEKEFYFHLKLIKNAQPFAPTYPFGGDSEIVNVENGQLQEIDFTAPIDSSALNAGKTRLPSTWKPLEGEETNISSSFTLEVQSITIDGERVGNNSNRFVVTINGTKVKFENKDDCKDVVVEIKATNPEFYDMDIVYTFNINVTDIKYEMRFIAGSGDQYDAATNTWVLGQTREHTINATTYQVTSIGSSPVDPAKVKTIVTSNFVESYVVTGDSDISSETNVVKSSLKLTIPEFVEEEKIYTLYFSVNGLTIGQLNVRVPASVTVEFTNPEGDGYLYGNTTYTTSASEGEKQIVKIKNDNRYSFESIQVLMLDTDGEWKDVTTKKGSFAGTWPGKFWNVTKVDGKGPQIQFYHTDVEHELRLKFTYSGESHEGSYTTSTLCVKPSIEFKETYDWGNITAGTDGTTTDTAGQKDFAEFAVPFKNALFITNFSAAIDSSNQQNVITNVELKSSSLCVKVSDTPQEVTRQVPVRFTYNVDDYTFSHVVIVSFNIQPAVAISVAYPKPNSTLASELDHETLSEKENYLSFLSGKAYLAEDNRFTFALTSGSTFDDYENVTTTLVSVSNGVKLYYKSSGDVYSSGSFARATQLSQNSSVTGNFSLAAELSGAAENGTAILRITYKQVSVDYNLYICKQAITGRATQSLNYNNATSSETIYSDKVDENGLFGSDRLLALRITQNVLRGQVYNVYEGDQNGTPDNLLVSFTMPQTVVPDQMLYVDWGGQKTYLVNKVLQGRSTILFYGPGGKTGGLAGGVNFEGFAGRVKYYYSTSDKGTIEIDHGITIGSDFDSDNSNTTFDAHVYFTFLGDNTNTHHGQITYKLERKVDVMVDNAYTNEGNPIAGVLETDFMNRYKLVETAGIRHASTGELISQESLSEKQVTINLEVVNPLNSNFGQWNNLFRSAVNDVTNTGNEMFKYRTEKNNKEYISFYRIAQTNDPNNVYDFYLYAEGCDNNGDYVLLRFTYQKGKVSNEFYIAYKIVPGYDISVNGETIVSSGETNSTTSNISNPYVFKQSEDDNNKTDLNLVTGDTDSILKVQRAHWNLNNIAINFVATMQYGNGSEYNEVVNLSKLGFEQSGDSAPTFKGEIWKGSGTNAAGTLTKAGGESANSITFTPGTVMFGDKKFLIHFENDFDYKIDLYFTLAPNKIQSPEVYAAQSAATFTEGEYFDIGTIFDKIIMENEDGSSVSIEPQQVPEGASISKVILRGIDAWGWTSDLGNKKDTAMNTLKGIDSNYVERPTLYDVKVSNVTFKYTDSQNSELTANGQAEIKPPYLASLTDVDLSEKPNKTNYVAKDTFTNSNMTYTIEDINFETANLGLLVLSYQPTKATPENEDDWRKDKGGYAFNVGKRKYLLTDDALAWGSEDANKTNLTQTGLTQSEITEGWKTVRTAEGHVDTAAIKVKTTKADGAIADVTFQFVSWKDESSTKIYLDLQANVQAKTAKFGQGEGQNLALATESLFGYYEQDAGTKEERGAYRAIERNYLVPRMDGWIYGTNQSAAVTMYITLTYTNSTDDSDQETYTIPYNVSITRTDLFQSQGDFVVDADSFNLGDYITATAGSGHKITSYYDDTLAVTVPNGNAQVNITLSYSEKGGYSTTASWTEQQSSHATMCAKTFYNSISDKVRKTISSDATITIQADSNESGATISYGGVWFRLDEKIVEINGTKYKWSASVNQLTLTPESGHSIPGSTATKTIKVGEVTYNYTINGDQLTLVSQSDNNTIRSKFALSAFKKANMPAKTTMQSLSEDAKDKHIVVTKRSKVDVSNPNSLFGGINLQTPDTQFLGITFSPNEIKTDTLFIEDSGIMRSVDEYYSLTKSYVISTGENGEARSYLYKKSFKVARALSFFNDGLGNSTALTINKNTGSSGTKDGYTTFPASGGAVTDYIVDLNVWAAKAKMAAANIDGEKPNRNSLTQGAFESLEKLISENPSKVRFAIGDDDSTAWFEDESQGARGRLHTGSKYTLNDQYILINIYVKSSGGPFVNFANSSSSDMLMDIVSDKHGTFRIILRGQA